MPRRSYLHRPSFLVLALLCLLAPGLPPVQLASAPLPRPTPASGGAPSVAGELLEPQDQAGGSVTALDFDDHYVYLGVGPRLAVIDVGAPGLPRLRSRSPILPGLVNGVAVAGHYAYVAAREGGLRIIDVSNPNSPVEAGSYPTDGVVYDVAVVGDLAYIAEYVADGSGGLRIVNVSNPKDPSEVGLYNLPWGATCVDVSDGYAYVCERDLLVVDVRMPSSAELVASVDTAVAPQDLVVAGNHVYVAANNAGLFIIDTTDPENPVTVGRYDPDLGFSYGVAVAGDYAFETHDGDIRVVNVSDPTAPKAAGSYKTPGAAKGIVTMGRYAYVADDRFGLHIVDVLNPEDPVRTGALDLPGYGTALAVQSSRAYVVDENRGVQIFHVSSLGYLSEAGFIAPLYTQPPSVPTAVAVSGGYAYVVECRSSGCWLRVVDVTTPSSPVEVSHLSMAGIYVDGMAVADGYVYLASGPYGLHIIDVNDAEQPAKAALLEMQAYGVAVAGHIAYVAGANEGLHVVDVTDPWHAKLLNTYDTAGSAMGVAVNHGYAYVADVSGLRIIDVRDPLAPAEVSFFAMTGRALVVAVAGGRAFVAVQYGDLRMLNVTHPEAPYEESSYPTAGNSLAVEVSGDYVCVADDKGGLLVLGTTGQTLSYPVSYVGPRFSLSEVMVNEADRRITMGDHVHLRLPFRNTTGQTLHEAQVKLTGGQQTGNSPGVSIYDGTDWHNVQQVMLTPSDIAPWGTGYADFWIYITDNDPDFRDSLHQQSLIRVETGDGIWGIGFALSPITFGVPSYEYLKANSCLHTPSNFEIRTYADYAAGAPSMSTPPTNAGDPDLPGQALRNLVNRVYKEFDQVEEDTDRAPDTVLLTRRFGYIGVCYSYADLTTGLTRALGFPARLVYANFAVLPTRPLVGHTWAEAYIPGEGGWRQVDSGWHSALDELRYIRSGCTVLSAVGDLYSLSSACTSLNPACRCVNSCYQAPIDCPDCRDWQTFSPTPWDFSCIEDVKGRYSPAKSSTLQPVADEDALAVQVEASVFVSRTVPFPVSAGITNRSADPIPAITATVSISNSVLSQMALFDVEPPPLHQLGRLEPGETITATWTVTPLLTGSGLPLRVAAFSDNAFAFTESALVVGEPGALPPLTVGGTCSSGQVGPGDELTLSASVKNEHLEPITGSGASVTATVFFSPTSEFSSTVLLVDWQQTGRYRGSVTLPVNAPAGRYYVETEATAPDHQPGVAQSVVWVAPALDVTMDLSAQTIRPQDTFTITVQVQDRGQPILTAGVWADVTTAQGVVRLPLLPSGGADYVVAFRPLDLMAEAASMAGGLWTIEATADWKGGAGSAIGTVLVRDQIFLPLVLLN